MEITIRAGRTRTVSSRELSRRTSDLLNEIDDEGHALVIVRFGRAAALLVPLERSPRSIRSVAIERHEDGPTEMPQLDDEERELLRRIAACHPEAHRTATWIGDIVRFCRTVGRLELAGLIENRGGVRQRLTSAGERVAAKISA